MASIYYVLYSSIIYLFQYFVFKIDKRTNSCPPKHFEILNKTVNLPFNATMIFHMQIVLDKSLLNDAIHISILQISWFQT